MGDLRDAIDGLLAVDPHQLSDAELAGDLVELRREIDRAEAAFLARVAVFDARRAYADDRAPTAAAWLRHHCRLSPGDASTRVRSARRLRDQLDATRDALATGTVTWPQARVICEQGGRVADRLGEAGAIALKEAEPIFLNAAQRLHPNDLGKVVRRWEHVVDSDGFLSDADRRHQRRYLRLSQGWDHMWHLEGLLDAESGAIVAEALTPLAAKPGPDDPRSAGQRRADALTEICHRVLDSGTLPQSGGEKPHLIVEVTLDTLERRLGCEPGELAKTGPISAETARRLACDAELTRLITGPDSMPLDVGRKTRTIPPAMRTALRHRDKGCRWAGCDHPPEWTDAHHRHHWADGGPTTLGNLVLLCRRHHRAVHEGHQPLPQPP